MIVSSQRLELWYYRPEDCDSIFKNYTGDVGSARYLAREPHTDAAQTERMLRALSNAESEALTGKWIWVLQAVEEGKPVGLITVTKDNESAVVHFGIGAPFRGRGYASEALALSAQYLLAARRAATIGSFTDVENTAAQAALVKAGFVCRGRAQRFYKAPQLNGEYRDVFRYLFRS